MQLLSYAKHRNVAKTNGFDSSTERGYSVYVFGPDPGDYCIFDEVWSFHYLRMLLWSSFGIIELAVTLAAPLLMISLHKVVAKDEGLRVSFQILFLGSDTCNYTVDCTDIHMQWFCHL